jgi:hypothetical protein
MDMEEVYFMHRIRHTKGVWDKGIEVKEGGTSRENKEAALQSYHSQLGAYAYGKDENTDFVACYITDTRGNRVLWELWDGRPQPEIEPEVEW